MQNKKKVQKPITVLNILRDYFKQFEKMDYVSEKIILNHSEPKSHYVNYYQQYKTKGVVNEQVVIYRLKDENFSLGVSINNIKSKEDAIFQLGCKLFEKMDKENRKGLLVQTPEMNFEQFRIKFQVFVSDLTTISLREALCKNFQLNIPDNEKIKDLLMDSYALSENLEDRLEFVKLVTNEKKTINDHQRKEIEDNIKKQVKETPIFKEIEDLEKQIALLEKQKKLKNKELSEIKKELLDQTNYEEVLVKGSNYERILREIKHNENFTIQQAENFLGQTIESLYVERQKESLLTDPTLQKSNENKKINRI